MRAEKMVRGDKIPLSRSYETAETSSTSLYSEDLLSRKVTDILDDDDDGDEERFFEDGNGDDGTKDEDNELVQSYNPYAQYSGSKTPSRSIHFADTQPVVPFVNNKKEETQDQDDSSVSSLSSFYKGLLGLKTTLRTRSVWKEDRPFDEESIMESELGEGVEIIHGFGVYTGTKDGGDKIMAKGREVTEVTCRTKSTLAKRKRRRSCWLLLCCLLVTVAIIVALVLGLRDEKKSKQVVQASIPGSDGKESRVPSAPSVAAPMPSPEPTTGGAPSPAPIPTLPTTSPVQAPTLPPNPSPTVLPTKLPTRLPTPFPTISPTKNPTGLPTASPVIDPTATPTSSPTACQNKISVDKVCHVEGQDLVVVDFVVCNPDNEDWVGIYLEEDGADPNDLDEDYVTWAYTCGQARCTDPPSQNRFAFDTNNLSRASFRAFLIPGSDDNRPYASIAMSESFEVALTC